MARAQALTPGLVPQSGDPKSASGSGVMDSCHSQVNDDTATVTMYESVQVPPRNEAGIFIIAASSVEVSGFGPRDRPLP